MRRVNTLREDLKSLKNLSSLLLLLFSCVATANNIDLSTVPPRETVQLTIYNGEDLTLVRDTRTVSVRKGLNPLQFSWANTLIDPSSVELRFLNQADKLDLQDTTFPHDKPQMLYWQVQSEYDGSVQIEISYFTSGINWQADYTAIANTEETEMQLESFVRVTNNSGEDYENAQVRLVVGTINLVEEIAQLTQVQSKTKPHVQRAVATKQKMRRLDTEALFAMDETDVSMASAMPAKPKSIAKESLSEYFLYTIEGTESIPHGWAKRLRSFKANNIPLDTQYRYRPQEYGDELVRLYLLRNDTASKLGETPLPNGRVHIFHTQANQSLSYLAEQSIQYVPIGDKLELNLGKDPSVVFELVQLKTWRDDILFKLRGVNVYKKLDGGFKLDSKSRVAGWDEHVLYTQRIRNYTHKPIDVEIRRSYQGDVVFRSGFFTKLYDYQTVEFTTQVQAGEKQDLQHEVLTRRGKNAKKNNVELEKL